ncbi:hypothetical protein GG344DRAFT_80099 [Lentinula edodes]|nr:hypothetical protein GG344DRAFT_80099 [Lentinula edodes]
MRTYSTLIPFVTLAVALAANAAPPTYSSSEGPYTHTALIRDAMSPDGFVEARGFADDDRYLFERSPPSSSDAPPPPPSGAQDTSPGGATSPAAVPGSLFSGPSPYPPPTKPLPPIPQGSPQYRREAAPEHHNLPAPEGGEKKEPLTQQKVEGPHHTGQAPHPVDEKKNPEHSPPPPVPTKKPGFMDRVKGFTNKAKTSAKDPKKQAALRVNGKKWMKYAGLGLGGVAIGSGITAATLMHEGSKESSAPGSSGSEGTASTGTGNTDATTGGGTSSSSSDTSSGSADAAGSDTAGSDTTGSDTSSSDGTTPAKRTVSRTLVPLVTIALTLAANAVPTSYYHDSGNSAGAYSTSVIGVASPTLSARGSGKPLSPIPEQDEKPAPEPKASAAVVIKSKFTKSPGPPPDHPAPNLTDLRKLGDPPHGRPLPPIPKPNEHSQPPAPPAVPARNPNRPTTPTPKSHERVPSNDSTVPNFSRPLTHSPSTSFNGLTPEKKNEPGAKTNETAVVKSNRSSTAKKVAIAGALMAAAGGGMAAGYGMGEESSGKETDTSDSNETPPDPTQTQIQDAGEPSAVKRSVIRSTYQRRISRWESDELD